MFGRYVYKVTIGLDLDSLVKIPHWPSIIAGGETLLSSKDEKSSPKHPEFQQDADLLFYQSWFDTSDWQKCSTDCSTRIDHHLQICSANKLGNASLYQRQRYPRPPLVLTWILIPRDTPSVGPLLSLLWLQPPPDQHTTGAKSALHPRCISLPDSPRWGHMAQVLPLFRELRARTPLSRYFPLHGKVEGCHAEDRGGIRFDWCWVVLSPFWAWLPGEVEDN